MDNIKAAVDLIQTFMHWSREQWTIFLTGFLIGGFIAYTLKIGFDKLRHRLSPAEIELAKFEAKKASLGRALSKSKIEQNRWCIRIWDNGLENIPVHIITKSEKNCRVLLPSGRHLLAPTGQLRYMEAPR